MDQNEIEKYIRMAMKQAEKAVANGGRPFGVVVLDGNNEVVCEEYDRVLEYTDPTAHGEINAIRKLCKKIGKVKLEGYSFFTNAEPCPNCLSAMLRAKVKATYFGARTEKDASLPIPVEELLKYSKHKIEVYPEILSEETLLHRNNLM